MTAARLCALAALGLSITACASSTTDNVAPAASMTTAADAPVTSVAPRNTGTYPNLNIAPRAAAPQLSDEETSSKKQELRQTLAGQNRAGANGAPGATDLQQLREIGRRQADAAAGQAATE